MVTLQVYYKLQEHRIAREYPIVCFIFHFVRYSKFLVSYEPLHPASVEKGIHHAINIFFLKKE